MEAKGLSQSEVARQVKVTQGAIAKIVSKNPGGSSHLHRIAEVLGTSPAYLLGETDDPDKNAPLPSPPAPPVIMMAVTLPPIPALARMFEALLAGIDRALPEAEQALLLAERLPIGLSQLRELQPASARSPARASREEDPARPAKPRHEPAR